MQMQNKIKEEKEVEEIMCKMFKEVTGRENKGNKGRTQGFIKGCC